MPKTTLEDKRRETLRRQLYGKDREQQAVVRVVKKQSTDNQGSSRTYSLSDHNISTSDATTIDTNYLTKDLTKVLTFSVLAIGVQITLYFLLQNHLVKLPF